jgi:hypothetical protein
MPSETGSSSMLGGQLSSYEAGTGSQGGTGDTRGRRLSGDAILKPEGRVVLKTTERKGQRHRIRQVRSQLPGYQQIQQVSGCPR